MAKPIEAIRPQFLRAVFHLRKPACHKSKQLTFFFPFIRAGPEVAKPRRKPRPHNQEATRFLLPTLHDNDGVRRAVLAILHYLRDHPQAKDSAKGIAQWWIDEKREVVEKALAFLVQSGVLIKKRHHYQLAQQLSPAHGPGQLESLIRDLQKKATAGGVKVRDR